MSNFQRLFQFMVVFVCLVFFIGSAGLTILSEGYTVPLGNVP